jgi:cytoskeletal protein RodZ
MNRKQIVLLVVLGLISIGCTTAALAQQESKQTTLVAQEDSPKARPADQQPEEPTAKPEQQEKQESPKTEKQENAKPEKNEKESKPAETTKGQATAPRENGNQPAAAQTGQARPEGRGGHIPDDKFKASFGRSHTFKVSRPVVVNNQTTIQYGGYSFILSDPWPAGWAYTDDCYIDYIDGEYFLFDLLHPGVRIALIVEM